MSEQLLLHWSKDVLLKNGASLRLRPIQPRDQALMGALFRRLSPQTIYHRFMSAVSRLDDNSLRRFTHLDPKNEVALVAVLEDDREPSGEKIIAVGRFVRLPDPAHAEVAFTVEDAYQGLGISTHLLQELIPFAQLGDIEVLEAEVLAENKEMLGVFRNMGFQTASRQDHGVIHIEFPLAETPLSQERRWARDRLARITSLERLFRPRSVAVIGASTREQTIGNALVKNLLSRQFNGLVFPVNPRHEVVCGAPCFPSVREIPWEVDLAVIAVPAARVKAVVQDCAAKHVRVLIIVSAGFAETGAAGKAEQEEILDLARRNGMRVVGPNCLGVLNTEPSVRLNANFAPEFPPAGHVALSSQSGALGIAILGLAKDLRLGISQFIGVGNKADISGNDLLLFWGDDPNTRVILLYLESFGNPRKFSRIARRVSRIKPIVVLKSGISPAGMRAVSSHTGTPPSSAMAAEALMAQTGIIRTHTMEQFFHAGKVLASQPLPAGNRLAILTNAGGPGILAADRAEAEGLALPTLSKRLQRALAAKLPATAVTGNPVDMIASATPEQYRLCLTRLLQSDEVDMVTVMFIPPLMVRVQEVAEAILNARKDSGVAKPVVAVLMAERREEPALMRLEQGGIPVFRFPEDAMVALTHLWRYQVWRSQEEGPRVRFDDVNSAAAREVIAAALRTPAAPGDSEKGRRGLSPSQAQSLLAAYGMLPPRPTAEPVRPDSPPVLELVLEVQSDPNFGPVFRVGLGGAFPDAYFSQSRLHPVTRQDAEGMLARFRPGRVPHGQELIIRDLSAVTDLLLRLSQLVEDHPEVAAVDLRLHWMDAMDQGFKWAEPRVCIAPLSPWDAFIFRHLDD